MRILIDENNRKRGEISGSGEVNVVITNSEGKVIAQEVNTDKAPTPKKPAK